MAMLNNQKVYMHTACWTILFTALWRRVVSIPKVRAYKTGIPGNSKWVSEHIIAQFISIYKAYFLGLCKGIYTQNMALYGTVPPF